MSTAHASPSLRDVDAAVRSVLGELFSVRSGRAALSPSRPGEELFSGQLLSLRQAEALRPGLRAVNVAPATVITPLARDFLKRAGVAIRVVSGADVGSSRGKGEWGFTIETESGLMEAFRRSLLDGPEPWHELGPALNDAAAWVPAGDGRGAHVVTDEASVAVFRACRVEGLRAAAADDPGAVSRAVRSLGVNLLVVEPAGKSIATLRQMAVSFRRAGGPVAPSWVNDLSGGGTR